MSALVLQIQHINQSKHAKIAFINDSFWNLLLLASVAVATLVGIEKLF